MLFNSFEYLLFFVVVLALSWALIRRESARIWLLLLASYYFYAANNHWLILLILLSTQIDYRVGIAVADSDDPLLKKRWLWVSLVGNLGILAFFKYFNFFVENAVAAGQALGLGWSYQAWSIALPVGISFYTFQSMSYTLDVYRGTIPPERSWSRFAFYVAYFPQLVAGPIMRASEFIPQIRTPQLTGEQLEFGLALIARGLIKKIVFADTLAQFADPAFDRPESVSTFGAWLGLYAFTFQIYFDFSGYSDIAIGCSRLCGYHLPDNFNLPYVATTFSDFWRRWHISLSTWLRDYLYISLGGNRMATTYGVMRNLMLTMVLGGLWHGAAWHFVIWGVLHGTYLAIERLLGMRDVAQQAWRIWLRRLFVFQCVVLTWLVFRSQTMELLGGTCRALLGGNEVEASYTRGTLLAIAIMLFSLATQVVGLRHDLTKAFLKLPRPLQAGAYVAVAILVSTFNSRGAQSFIYFAF